MSNQNVTVFQTNSNTKPTAKGWRSWEKNGVKKRSLVMEHEAQIDTWEIVDQYRKLVNTLRDNNNLPPTWNHNDDGVIVGFSIHLAPYGELIDGQPGLFLDPIEDQIHKYYLAIRKLHEHLEGAKISKKDMLKLLKIDIPSREMTKSEMFKHCETRRKLKTAVELNPLSIRAYS
jgi:hypothetical protein